MQVDALQAARSVILKKNNIEEAVDLSNTYRGNTMNNRKKIKYDSAYISYVEKGYSAAVFIVRDIVKSIDTSGMWIDVLSTSGYKNRYGQWDFSSIKVELFPRITTPVYPKNVSLEVKKLITWQTATKDISSQRQQGFKGKKYIIHPKLVDKNKGKTKTIEMIWNRKFEQYIPNDWMRSPDCEIHEKKVSMEPEWEYHIISVKRL